MPIFRSKDRWRYSFNRVIKGQRYRFTKLLPQGWGRGRAEAYARQQEATLYAQASGIESKECLIDEAVKAYLLNIVPHRKRGKKSASSLAMLLPWYEGRPMSALPEVGAAYVRDTPALSPATQYQRLAFLKAACKYAYKKGICPTDYTGQIEMPAVHNERQAYITVAQLNKLLACFEDDEARALVKMAFYTGLRWISELLPLTPVNVKRVKGDLWLDVGMTKNGTPRMVPVHPAIRGCLKWLPWSRSDTAFWVLFDRARKKAGMPEFRLHDCRHSLASAIVSAGGTLHDVAAALHHESLASSKRYAHLYPARLQAIYRRVK